MAPFASSRVVEWLHACQSAHTKCQEERVVQGKPVPSLTISESSAGHFRLLDIERRCLVTASLDDRYVVLSYIRGTGTSTTPVPRLTQANCEQWSTEGAFTGEAEAGWPAVFRDAVRLVQDVGERYLWVGALCLVHDDPGDLRVGRSLQYSILRNALFVVVAAAATASDAVTGLLPASRSGPNSPSPVAAATDVHQSLSQSVHASQGCTLVEVAAARRAVIFTPAQVFFCCQQGSFVWSDEEPAGGLLSTSATSPVDRIPGPLDGVLASLVCYIELSVEYTRRQTHASDAHFLWAFGGISRALFAGMQSIGIQGLPGFFVNAFLLFRMMSPAVRRRPAYASYTWAGWDGPMAWLFSSGEARESTYCRQTALDVVRWLKYDSLAEWSELTSSGELVELQQHSTRHRKPSSLARFVQEQAHLFPGVDIRMIDCNDHSVYSRSKRGYLDMVDWDRDVLDLEADAKGAAPRPPRHFSRWAFDLVNSRGELDRLLRQIETGISERALRSWAASRAFGALTIPEARKRAQLAAAGRDGSNTPGSKRALPAGDTRASNAQRADPETSVPRFPPYSVLSGWVVHLQLAAGPCKAPAGSWPTAPLYSAADVLVGRLYPDEGTRFFPSRTEVDLVVLGRAHTDAVSEAPAVSGTVSDARPSLWVLCVEWQYGIAERRGIGCIQMPALADALAPGPSLKQVLLG